MARIRTIKPTFFTSLTIADLSYEQRLTFVGMWTHVDDEGRCVDDARLIKAAVWPLDDRTAADVEDDLRALTELSLITRYTLTRRSYIAISGWAEHQRINRPTPSRYPAPDQAESAPEKPLTSSNERSSSTHTQLSEPSRPEGNREQGREQGTGNRKKHRPGPLSRSQTRRRTATTSNGSARTSPTASSRTAARGQPSPSRGGPRPGCCSTRTDAARSRYTAQSTGARTRTFGAPT